MQLAGSVGLMMPLLAELLANASASLAAAWAVLDLNAIVPERIVTAFSAFGGAIGGIDRAMAVGIVVALVVRQYGSRLFRLGESRG